MVESRALSREKALALLRECRILALKLEAWGQGMDITITTDKDHQILKGFEMVWLVGWLADPSLQVEAELSPVHIAILGYLLAQERS